MKSINLYGINDKLYIVPNSVLKNGPKVMSGKPYVLELDETELEKAIVISFEACSSLQEEPAEDYFKLFLKLSKIKSHKNLIDKAKLLLISESDEFFFIDKMKSNFKYKSFEGFEKIKIDKIDRKLMIQIIIEFFKI